MTPSTHTPEAKDKHAAYMREYLNDPAHPERIEEKRKRDRAYGAKNAAKVRAKVKQHYQEHKEERQEYVQRYQMLRKIKAVNYLGGKCECGEEHPSALQFHHRDPSTKLFNITTKHLGSPKLYPWNTVIVPELDKCDLLCANCHFKEHAVLPWEVIEELKRQAEEEDE